MRGTNLAISERYSKVCRDGSYILELREEIVTADFVHDVEDIGMTEQHHLRDVKEETIGTYDTNSLL